MDIFTEFRTCFLRRSYIIALLMTYRSICTVRIHMSISPHFTVCRRGIFVLLLLILNLASVAPQLGVFSFTTLFKIDCILLCFRQSIIIAIQGMHLEDRTVLYKRICRCAYLLCVLGWRLTHTNRKVYYYDPVVLIGA